MYFIFNVLLISNKDAFRKFFISIYFFPLTIGEGRFSSNETAYLGLIDQLNFKRIFGEFKFIHIFLIPLIIVAVRNCKRNDYNLNLLNLIIVSASIAFIFNQLLTANQIYIFSLIPILAAVLQINILKFNYSFKFIWIIIFIVIFATIKFHFRYNIERKFHDLEAVDKSTAIDASKIHKNLKGLKWVTKFNPDPANEINTIKQALQVIDNEQREKILITHYQFISTILDKDLNIMNRWYLWDNNTHPLKTINTLNFIKK